jgi:hypothetical protein
MRFPKYVKERKEKMGKSRMKSEGNEGMKE